jgi:hypothetical protein
LKKSGFGFLAIFIIGICAAGFLWFCSGDSEETRIIPNSPFAKTFPDGLHPGKEAIIKDWFLSSIPKGTNKQKVSEILSRSFNTNIANGKVRIQKRELRFAGSDWTDIHILFDWEDKVIDIIVDQHSACL